VSVLFSSGTVVEYGLDGAPQHVLSLPLTLCDVRFFRLMSHECTDTEHIVFVARDLCLLVLDRASGVVLLNAQLPDALLPSHGLAPGAAQCSAVVAHDGALLLVADTAVAVMRPSLAALRAVRVAVPAYTVFSTVGHPPTCTACLPHLELYR
jgi:hypothetical protein